MVSAIGTLVCADLTEWECTRTREAPGRGALALHHDADCGEGSGRASHVNKCDADGAKWGATDVVQP
eukprot:6335207-Prymnesium_polylepis.2